MERKEAAARILQKHVRGLLIRQRLRKVLQAYLEVVREIEGEEVGLQWGKWFLSNPQFTTRDVELPRSGDSLQFQPRDVSVGAGGVMIEQTIVSLFDKEKHIQSLEKKCCPAETVVPERELAPAETVVPERELAPAETVVPERELAPAETVVPERELAPAEIVVPERELAPAEIVVPERELAPAEIVVPEMELAPAETVGLQKESYPANNFATQKELTPAETVIPEREHCPLYLDTSYQNSLKLKKHNSCSKDELLYTDLSLKNVTELRKHRSHLAMEMLWVQQAIASRKNYLMVRQKLEIQN